MRPLEQKYESASCVWDGGCPPAEARVGGTVLGRNDGRKVDGGWIASVVMLGEECGPRLVGQRGRRASVVRQQGRARDEVRVTRHLRGGGVEEPGRRSWKGAQEPEAERMRADPRETQ